MLLQLWLDRQEELKGKRRELMRLLHHQAPSGASCLHSGHYGTRLPPHPQQMRSHSVVAVTVGKLSLAQRPKGSAADPRTAAPPHVLVEVEEHTKSKRQNGVSPSTWHGS